MTVLLINFVYRLDYFSKEIVERLNYTLKTQFNLEREIALR